MTPCVLESGLVHIPAAVDEAAQLVLAQVARKAGGGGVNGGFWCGSTPGDAARLNHSPSWGRGRVYAALDSFPHSAELRQICEDVVAAARRADSSMPSMTPTHLLLNYYGKGCGITTHVDNAENDGDGDRPVVSISLGNTCNFELKHKRHFWKDGYSCDTPPGPCHRVALASSDALLFGGASRMIQHAIVGRTLQDGTSIRAISPGTAPLDLDLGPELLPGHGVRVSFTFRETPNVIGSEHLYKSFKATTAQRKRQSLEPTLTTTKIRQTTRATDTWEIEKIVGKRTRARKTEYLVLWKGFSANESTWEPRSSLKCAMDLVRAFETKANQKRTDNLRTEDAAVAVHGEGYAVVNSLVGARVAKAFGTKLYGG